MISQTLGCFYLIFQANFTEYKIFSVQLLIEFKKKITNLLSFLIVNFNTKTQHKTRKVLMQENFHTFF